jgi:hypothetical protein
MKKQILNKEFHRMQKLAGLITESEYKAKLNENKTAKTLYQMFKDEDLLDDRREYDVEDLMSTYPDLSQEEAKKLEKMLQDPSNLNESKLNENPNRMLELIEMYVDNYSDEGMSAEAAIKKIDQLLQGNLDGYDKAFLKGEEDLYENQLNENTIDIMAVLNRNGIDEDYFESMGGKEVESGTEEWLDVLSDITGKDAYEGEFTPEDDKLIQKFISDMEALGIELI